jgi:alanine racemase
MPAQSNPPLDDPTVPHAEDAADAPWVDRGVRDQSRAWVEVDLDALVTNARKLAARSRVPLLPMVKADAYGLGAVPVARALEAVDPWGFGVATTVEGEELRAAGIDRRILVVTPLLPAELPRAHAAGLTPSLHRAEDVVRWTMLGGASWHLSIDTGMSRAGVRWDEIGTLASIVAAHPPEGAFTHFHSADTDDASRVEQEHRFRAAIDALPAHARPSLLHAENSAGIEHAAPSPWSIARPGVFLYGVGSAGALQPEPVAQLRARIVDLRTVRAGETVSYGATWRADGDRTIATVACGYGDGYRRHLSGRGIALVHGRRVPVAGRVTMDMTMLDVTGVACAVGDVATLIGRDGDELLTVSDVAAAGDLSPYELLTGLRQRVPRLYQKAS